MSYVHIPWEDLPLVNGEEDNSYQNAYARYSHGPGCPGLKYEDNCAEPWECASKGRCRILYEQEPERRKRLGA